MLSLAAFYNRALNENISITIHSSSVSFIKGPSGPVPAQLPAVPVPVWHGAAPSTGGTSSLAARAGLRQLLCNYLCHSLPP